MKARAAAIAVAGWLAVGGAVMAAAPDADAAIPFTVCPSGVTGVATPDTSCAFADNVSLAWYGQPGRTVFAYSPVTGQIYTMQCDPTITTIWWEAKYCYGLNSYGALLAVYVD